ncbi:MAG: hypothetical protein IH845_02025, partial [Nanoarchaeota archaeon]|nr:hypothetical protein [Nanoarchaeota archaeon]
FGGESGSGGGGGVIGGGGLILTSASFKIEPVSAIVFIGEEKSLKVVVQNNGRITANKCFLFAKAGYEDYIESELISNIGVGEIVEFPFVLNVLDKDVLLLDLKLNCLDFIGVNVTMDIILLEYELGVEFDSISFVSDDELLVSYSINPNVDFSDTLFFKIVDAYEEVISIKIIDHNLVRDGLFTGKVLFDIGAAEEGLLKIRVFDSNEFLLIEEAIIYGGSAITGFVSLGILDGNDILIGGIVLIFLVISSFVIFRIIKLKRGESPRLRDARVVKIIKASSIGQALAFTNKRNMAVDPKGRKRGV